MLLSSQIHMQIPLTRKQIKFGTLSWNLDQNTHLPKPLSPNKDDIPTPEFVIEFIDAVAENLTVLLQINDPCSLLFVPGPKEQIEDVLKELKLLRLFASFVSD